LNQKLNQIAQLDLFKTERQRNALSAEGRAINQLKPGCLQLVIQINLIIRGDNAPDGAAAFVDSSVLIAFYGSKFLLYKNFS
jgi:hypothetical protein